MAGGDSDEAIDGGTAELARADAVAGQWSRWGQGTQLVFVALVATILAITSIGGTAAVIGAIAVLVVAFAWGWPAAAWLPSPGGSSVVVAVAGTGALVAIAMTQQPPWLETLPLVAALGVILAVVNELLRPGERVRLTDSLTGTATGVIFAIGASGWLAVLRIPGGDAISLAAAIAFATASAAGTIPAPNSVRKVVVLTVSTISGVAVGLINDGGGLMADSHWVATASAGLGAGLLVLAGLALFRRPRHTWQLRSGVGAALAPLTLGGILVYAAARVALSLQ